MTQKLKNIHECSRVLGACINLIYIKILCIYWEGWIGKYLALGQDFELRAKLSKILFFSGLAHVNLCGFAHVSFHHSLPQDCARWVGCVKS